MHTTHRITTTSAPVVTLDQKPSLTTRYAHIQTATVVEALERLGWQYTDGTQRNSRKPEIADFRYHLLRFEHPSLPEPVPGTNAQCLVINSHDGSCPLTIQLGAWRMACANGLIMPKTPSYCLRIRHLPAAALNVTQSMAAFLDTAPAQFHSIREWSMITLDTKQQTELATAAARARWDSATQIIDAEDLLRPRRSDDTGTDAWTTFNRIQESIIRGGIPVRDPSTPNDKGRHCRPLSNPSMVVALNQSIWETATNYISAL